MKIYLWLNFYYDWVFYFFLYVCNCYNSIWNGNIYIGISNKWCIIIFGWEFVIIVKMCGRMKEELS